MFLLLAYYDDGDPYEENLKLLGVYSEFSNAHEACKIHAKTFHTNGGKPLDWSKSSAVAECEYINSCGYMTRRYFLESAHLDRMPDYSMRTN